MAEYIDREALLKEVNKLKKSPWYNNTYYGDLAKRERQDGVNTVIDLCIKDVPTADVVEVVRCKDCKYCTPYEAANGCTFCKCDYIKFSGFLLDDYCSYGERKG